MGRREHNPEILSSTNRGDMISEKKKKKEDKRSKDFINKGWEGDEMESIAGNERREKNNIKISKEKGQLARLETSQRKRSTLGKRKGKGI